MIAKCYSIKDELKGFAPMIPFMNGNMSEEAAKRYFKTHMIETLEMKDNPEDYSLYYMGTFDTDSGTFIHDMKGPKRIMKGVDVIGREN